MTRYRDAGVDVARADQLKRDIARAARTTFTDRVVPIVGGFAGAMRWPGAETSVPFLLATMDGVGTKLLLAQRAGRVADAAADLVYHCANDLLVHGARPLAFLDYLAQSRLEPETVTAAIEGLRRACSEVGAALLGGETAEMPDTYLDGAVDLAGCMIGAADRVLDGAATRPGDHLLGLASEGLHTNGYSLARRVLADSKLALSDPLPGGRGESVGEALLRRHRWYGPSLARPMDEARIRALAHVTGGGIAGNLARVLPEGCRARVRASAWPRPALMAWLIAAGQVPEDDAREALNLGIGMIVVCAPEVAGSLALELERAGEKVHALGEIVPGARGVEWVDA